MCGIRDMQISCWISMQIKRRQFMRRFIRGFDTQQLFPFRKHWVSPLNTDYESLKHSVESVYHGSDKTAIKANGLIRGKTTVIFTATNTNFFIDFPIKNPSTPALFYGAWKYFSFISGMTFSAIISRADDAEGCQRDKISLKLTSTDITIYWLWLFSIKSHGHIAIN